MDNPSKVTATPAQLLYEQQHITDNRTLEMIASHVICLMLAFIAVCLRFLSRRIGRIDYMADDWWIVNALVFTAAVVTCDMLATTWGVGRHMIVASDPKGLIKAILAAEVLYNIAMFSIKISVLYLYHRVFFVSRKFTKVLWGVGIFFFIYSSVTAGAGLLQCIPINYIWDPSVKGGRCLAIPLAGTILAAVNVLTDIVILIMPMPILWKLQIEMREKLQIMGIFLLGGFVLSCSTFRAVIIHSEGWIDPSYGDVSMGVWTLAELGIGIVSACLPTMRPLYTKTRDKMSTIPSSSNESVGETRPSSDSSRLHLGKTPSIPAQSMTFAHLGVIGGDLEIGIDAHKASITEKPWFASDIPSPGKEKIEATDWLRKV